MSYLLSFTNSTAPVPLTAFFNGAPVISPATLSFTFVQATGNIVVLDGFFGVVWELSGPGIGPNTPLTLAAIGGLNLSKVTGVNPTGDIIVTIQGWVRDAGGGSPDLTLDILTTLEWPELLDAGRDRITMSQQDDIVPGLGGNDIISGLNGDDTLTGGDGKDRILGGNGDDVIAGDAGNDDLRGNAGNDTITGGAGADSVTGGSGADTLAGGAGRDTVLGGSGDDILNGDAGEDLLRGEAGMDEMFGGAANDKMYGGAGGDDMAGGQGNDLMLGQGGNDTLQGDGGRDRLVGGSGDDVLLGGAGNDRLFGGKGADRLVAGLGNDTMSGSTGADVFEFAVALNEGTNRVRDFSDGVDMIRIAGESFDDLTIGTLGTATRVVTTSGTEIILQNIAITQIDQDDFIFV